MLSISYGRFGKTALLALGCLLASCEDAEDKRPPPSPGTDNGGNGNTGATGSGATGTGSGSSGSTGTGTAANCGELVCRGHGSCQMGSNGEAMCVCDEGYILNPNDATECIVDENCVQLRFLEDHCRQIYNGMPAVSLFFAVDFCSGTAVLPSKLEELGLEFKILENGADIADNVESSAQVVQKGVESYVTLVVDASDSLTGSEDLPQLVSELGDLVTSLKPSGGQPPVHVSVLVFARRVQEYVPFTTDLDLVTQKLNALAADPGAALQHPVYGEWKGMGTALYDAVYQGIDAAERVRAHRDAITAGGVLTTGTVVVVTDGKDTSDEPLDTGRIEQTLNQVISIGVSTEIDDADLDAIGRDGSFLAPSPSDWPEAFGEITTRVEQYPQRAYFLGYCSSAISGTGTVTVTLDGPVEVQRAAGCEFDADRFGSNPPECTAAFFDNECNDKACGGLTACGACGDEECCNGNQCTAPSTREPCNGVDELCQVSDQICLGDGSEQSPWVCGEGGLVGDPCGTGNPPCEPGVAWCNSETGQCEATFGRDEACESAEQCQSLSCNPDNSDNPLDPDVCQEPARMFDVCDGGSAVCEPGSYCAGSVCAPKKWWSEPCSGHEECISGLCHADNGFCADSGVCAVTWSDVLAR